MYRGLGGGGGGGVCWQRGGHYPGDPTGHRGQRGRRGSAGGRASPGQGATNRRTGPVGASLGRGGGRQAGRQTGGPFKGAEKRGQRWGGRRGGRAAEGQRGRPGAAAAAGQRQLGRSRRAALVGDSSSSPNRDGRTDGRRAACQGWAQAGGGRRSGGSSPVEAAPLVRPLPLLRFFARGSSWTGRARSRKPGGAAMAARGS